MSTFRVKTQFDIRSHHYTACVYSKKREIQTMRIYFLEKFQSVDSARSTAPRRAYKVHQRYNLYHVYFPRYNPVWYSFAPLYSVYVYSIKRKIQTMRIYFLEKFQSADSARSTALQRPTRATKDIISIIFTFRDMTQFDIRLHHYTAYMYIAWNGRFKPCGFISWKNFKMRTARDRQPYKGPTRVTKI